MGIEAIATPGEVAVAALVFLSASAGRTEAGLVVDSWDVACVVVPPDGPPRGALFRTVQDPFCSSHQITWQGATDSAAYQVAFTSHSFDFRVDTSVTAPGSPPIFTSVCEGLVRLTADTDLLLTVDGAVDYALPSGDREAIFDVAAREAGGPYCYADGAAAAPIFGDPPRG